MRFTFPDFPRTYEEFLSLASDLMTRPEGTAALLIVALKVYTNDRDAGLTMLNHLHGPRPLSNHDKQFLADRLSDKLYLPDSYAVGATVDNNYTPDDPFTVIVEQDPVPAGKEYLFRVRITSSAPTRRASSSCAESNPGCEWFVWSTPVSFPASAFRKRKIHGHEQYDLRLSLDDRTARRVITQMESDTRLQSRFARRRHTPHRRRYGA